MLHISKLFLLWSPKLFSSNSGDLKSELVRYSNGPKQFVHQMVRYSSHVLNSELIVCYSNGKKLDNQMAFGYWTLDHSIGDHLNTEQLKACYSDKFTIWMFTIQIPHCIWSFRLYKISLLYLWLNVLQFQRYSTTNNVFTKNYDSTIK